VGTDRLLTHEEGALRLGEPSLDKKPHCIGIELTVVALLLYFDFFNPNTRYANYYHRHELYHYYLGSKYFTEVGYDRLYTCTAIAEVELGRGAQIRKREIRDLGAKNLIMPTTDTYIFDDPGQCKNHFAPERWESFKQDVTWFEQSSRGEYWENMQKDHGYNPPPVWTMTGKFFGSFWQADDGFFKVLASIDMVLHAGINLLFYWAFGWRTMAVPAMIWGAKAPAYFYETGGAFLRQDWLFLLVAALCCARRRYFVLAGFALTWSALLRIFPGIFVAGWAIIIGIYLLQSLRHGPRKIAGDKATGILRYLHPDHRRVIMGCVLAIGVLVPASMAVCWWCGTGISSTNAISAAATARPCPSWPPSARHSPAWRWGSCCAIWHRSFLTDWMRRYSRRSICLPNIFL
jgi:hypothetical protein